MSLTTETMTQSEQPYITPSSRDLRLDLLKGYFIIRMLLGHSAGYSILQWVIGGTGFLVSGAEGFLFLSGLLAGIVYYRVIHKSSLGEGVKKAASRCVNLYLIALTASLIFMFISEHFHLRWARELPMSLPILLVIQTMTHKLSYPYTEILQVYALFFLFLPLVLVFLEKGNKRIIMAVSVILYLAYLFSPRAGNIPVLTNEGNFINFSAAQLLMVIGLLIGYSPSNENKFLTRPIPRVWLIIAAVGALLTIFIYYLIKNPSVAANFGLTPENLRWISTKAFSKVNLGPARLAAFFCFFIVLFHLTTRFWYRVNQWLGWLLLPLGQFSLKAYVIHLGLILIAALVYQGLALTNDNQWVNLISSSLTIGIAWWFTRNRWLTPNPRTIRSWYYIPAIVIVLFIGIETIYRLPGVYEGLREIFATIQNAMRVQ